LTLGSARLGWAQRNTEPDNKYGPGGTRTWSEVKQADGTTETTTTWKDAKGTIRKTSTETLASDGELTVKDEWFNEQGKKIHEEMGKYNRWDYEDYWREETYVDGVLDSGELWEWDRNTEDYVHKAWNKTTQRYEDVPRLKFKLLNKILGFEKEVLIEDALYVGGAVVREDGGQSFGTYGVNASYVRPLKSNRVVGLMADVQWTRGSENVVTFTKLQLLGGLSLSQHVHNAWSLTPHVLAGVATVTPSSNGVSYDSTTAFALAVGVDIGMRFNRRTEWIGRADYNPTFNSGVQNNFRFSTGLRYTF
jgi:hypothetical protein